MELIKSEWGRVKSFYHDDFRQVLKTTAIAFIVLTLAGFAAGMFLPDLAGEFFERFAQQIQDAGIIQDDGSVSAMALFVNNVRSALYTAVYGFIPFIFLPALSLGLNALMLGFFGAYYLHHDLPLIQYIMGILPHGIFELPALVVAVAVGLYLCRCITDFLRHKTRGIVLPAISNGSRVLLMITIPLLAVASVIEAYVTPFIMNLF